MSGNEISEVSGRIPGPIPPGLDKINDSSAVPGIDRSTSVNWRSGIAMLIAAVMIYFGFHLLPGRTLPQAMLLTAEQLPVNRYEYMAGQSNQHYPISENLVLTLIGSENYLKSPGGGYWTPRRELAEGLSAILDYGAKIVVVDFWPYLPIPAATNQDLPRQEAHEDQQMFMELMTKTLDKAKQNEATVIFVRDNRVKSHEDAEFQRFLDGWWPAVKYSFNEAIYSYYGPNACWSRYFQSKMGRPYPSAAWLAFADHKLRTLGTAPEPSMIEADAFYLRTLSILPHNLHIRQPKLKNVPWPVGELDGTRSPRLTYQAGSLHLAGLSPMAFDGKIVIFGTDDTLYSGDVHQVAFAGGKDEPASIPGVYLLANDINMLLTGDLPKVDNWNNHIVNLVFMAFLIFLITVMGVNGASRIWVNLTLIASFFILQFIVAPYFFIHWGVILAAFFVPVVIKVAMMFCDLVTDPLTVRISLWVRRRLAPKA